MELMSIVKKIEEYMEGLQNNVNEYEANIVASIEYIIVDMVTEHIHEYEEWISEDDVEDFIEGLSEEELAELDRKLDFLAEETNKLLCEENIKHGR